MTLIFGSKEASAIVAEDKLQEKLRALHGARLEEIESELVLVADEIEFCETELNDLKYRRRDLETEQKRLEKGEPG